MKTFKQFIAEAAPQELEDFVVEHCHQWLSALDIDIDELSEYPLWRGMDLHSGTEVMLLIDGKPRRCFTKTVRKNRAPLDTNAEISSIVDDMFESKFGWRPRQEGLFCFGKSGRSITTDYGTLHQIIPIGKFKYIWSPTVADLIEPVNSVMRHLKLNKHADDFTSDQKADFYEIISDRLEASYKDTDIHAAISGPPREIMIDCATYLAIPFGIKKS